MSILNMFTVQLGQQNSQQRLVRVHCNDTLAKVLSTNFLQSYMSTHAMNLFPADSILVSYSGGEGLFTPILSQGNVTLQIGTIFSAGLSMQSTTSGIVALAGGGQTGATPLLTTFNNVSTVVSANDSVMLPNALGNVGPIWVTNSTASTACNIYPQVGQKIDDGTVNAPISLPGNTSIVFFNPTINNWYAIG
jgi:hypothetical protein